MEINQGSKNALEPGSTFGPWRTIIRVKYGTRPPTLNWLAMPFATGSTASVEFQIHPVEVCEDQVTLNALNEELEDASRGAVAVCAEPDQGAIGLRRASHMRTGSLSNLSHEVTTPLNSIPSLTRLLLSHTKGDLEAEHETQNTFIEQLRCRTIRRGQRFSRLGTSGFFSQDDSPSPRAELFSRKRTGPWSYLHCQPSDVFSANEENKVLSNCPVMVDAKRPLGDKASLRKISIGLGVAGLLEQTEAGQSDIVPRVFS